jgi:nitrite reductase/ring-hydroxylating ferredoxin subunit
MNVAATALVATGFFLRRNENRAPGAACTAAGFGVSLAAAYLGGDLVYHERIGVTHAAVAEPETFTPVMPGAIVADNSMRKAVIEDASFLIVRQRQRVCALAHPCAHLGGPLSEGTLKDGSVVCPWHGSEFALDDGHVINGPATQPQPCFAVREREGQIEVSAQGRAG